MEPLMVSLEPEPTWFGEVSAWNIDNQIIRSQEDLSRLGLGELAPPQIGYIWTSKGRFSPEDHLPIFQALRQLDEVFLWTWFPLQRFFPDIQDPLPTLPGLTDLKDASEKIAHVVQVPDRPAWYWAAVRIGEDTVMHQAAQSSQLPTSFLLTTHTTSWQDAAKELANELQLEQKVAENRLLLAPFMFRTIVRLTAEGNLLLKFLFDIASDRSVIVIYGQRRRMQQLINEIARCRPTRLVEPKEMWIPPA